MEQQAQRKRTKSDAVREILKEIGALTENPPEGWRKKVEDALKKQKMEMHHVTIYQIRQSEMKKLAGDNGHAEAAEGVNGKRPKKKARTAEKLTLGDVREIQKFAARFGGLKGLGRACQEIEAFIR